MASTPAVIGPSSVMAAPPRSQPQHQRDDDAAGSDDKVDFFPGASSLETKRVAMISKADTRCPSLSPGLGDDSSTGSTTRHRSPTRSSPPTSPSSCSHPDAKASIQPSYFYPMDPSNPNSHLDESGIPVFEPTMEQFSDFYRFCESIDSWGMRTGIVKVIPPKEWTDALPSIRAPEVAKHETNTGLPSGSLPTLESVRIKSAIAQHFGPAKPGLWRQTNITRPAKIWNVKQWSEACKSLNGPCMDAVKDLVDIRKEMEAGATQSAGKKDDSGIRTRSGRGRTTAVDATASSSAITSPHRRKRRGTRTSTSDPTSPPKPEIGTEAELSSPLSDQVSGSNNADVAITPAAPKIKAADTTTPEEWAEFDENSVWREAWAKEGCDPASFPEPSDWSPEACREIEGEYWRGLNFGKPPMYGADLKGTLFTPATKAWNVNSLDNLLTRLKLRRKIAGVTDPYLYFGMWRATFAWHVEDMDLYSINYIHFGAPKQWYAIPQRDRLRFETALASAFPGDARRCSQFMRHKSFLASPTFLAANNIRPLKLVQHAREFVITYPYGYHSGFNLGFNCAESVNFALDSWLDIGRKAKACECQDAQQSVTMDVDALLEESEELEKAERRREERERAKLEREELNANDELRKAAARERRAEKKRLKEQQSAANGSPAGDGSVSEGDRPRKKPRKSFAVENLPCILCPSSSTDDLVAIPPETNTQQDATAGNEMSDHSHLQAHRFCANSIPECWVERNSVNGKDEVQGYYTIAKARWTLKCSLCSAASAKYGCAVQCTFGTCAKAAHPTCAAHESSGWLMDMLPTPEADKLEARGQFAPKARKAKKITADKPATAESDGEKSCSDVVEGSQQPLPSSAVTSSVDLEPTPEVPGSGARLTQAANAAAMDEEPSMIEAPGIDTNLESSPTAEATSERLVILCRAHNPAAKEADHLRKVCHLRECALRLLPGSRIKVKTNGGIWETTLLALKDGPSPSSEGEALVDDAKGPRRVIKWSRIIFPPDIVAPASQVSENAEANDLTVKNEQQDLVRLDSAALERGPVVTLPRARLLTEAEFSQAKNERSDVATAIHGRLLGGAQPQQQFNQNFAVPAPQRQGKGRGSNEYSSRELPSNLPPTSLKRTNGVHAPEKTNSWSVAPLGAHTSSSRVSIGSSSNSTLITPASTPTLHPYAMTKGPGYGYGTNSFGHHSLQPVRQKVFPELVLARRARLDRGTAANVSLQAPASRGAPLPPPWSQRSQISSTVSKEVQAPPVRDSAVNHPVGGPGADMLPRTLPPLSVPARLPPLSAGHERAPFYTGSEPSRRGPPPTLPTLSALSGRDQNSALFRTSRLPPLTQGPPDSSQQAPASYFPQRISASPNSSLTPRHGPIAPRGFVPHGEQILPTIRARGEQSLPERGPGNFLSQNPAAPPRLPRVPISQGEAPPMHHNPIYERERMPAAASAAQEHERQHHAWQASQREREAEHARRLRQYERDKRVWEEEQWLRERKREREREYQSRGH